MVRTQIQLTEEQARALREVAAREGRSMADVIRTSLDQALRSRGVFDREETKRRALAAIGRFRSGADDVARDHDRYLDVIPGDLGLSRERAP